MVGWLESFGDLFEKDKKDDIEATEQPSILEATTDYMDDTGSMGLVMNPQIPAIAGGIGAAYQFGRDLLGYNPKAQVRAEEARKDDEGITPTKNYIYDTAVEAGASPYVAQTAGFAAEVLPGLGEYMGGEETVNLLQEGRYGDAALAGVGTVLGVAPFAGDYLKSALRTARGDPPPLTGVKEMFLNRNIAKGAKYDTPYDQAVAMDLAGKNRDEIWKETGWGKIFGEWMTETDDSITTTKGVQDAGTDLAERTSYRPETITTENVVTKAVNTYKAKKEISLRYKELVRLAKGKPMTPEALTAEIEKLQFKMNDELNAVVIPVTPQTIEITTPAGPSVLPDVPNLKRKGPLPNVLGRLDEVTDLLPNSTRKDNLPQGTMTGATAGVSGTRGGGVYKREILPTIFNKGRRSNAISRSYDDLGGKTLFRQDDEGKFTNASGKGDYDVAEIIKEKVDAIDAKVEQELSLIDSKKDAAYALDVNSAEFKKLEIEFDRQYRIVKENAETQKQKLYRAGIEDRIWGTMLHETQHWLDDVFGSTSGKGATNKDSSRWKSLRAAAKKEYEATKKEIVAKYGSYDNAKISNENIDAFLEEKMALESSGAAQAMLKPKKGANDGRLTDLDLYYSEAGETKARLTDSRRRLTAEQRRETSPWQTLSEMQKYEPRQKVPTSDDEVWSPSRFNDYWHDYAKNPPLGFKPNFWNPNKSFPLKPSSSDNAMSAQMNEAFDTSPSSMPQTPRVSTSKNTILEDAPTNAQEVLGITDEMKQTWRSNRPKKKQERTPQLQEGVNAMLNNEITYNEYLELADTFRPIKPITEVPVIPTTTDIVSSLKPDQVNKGIIGVTKEIEEGTRVASRLDISAYENFDTWVVSLHDGVGDSLSGASVAHGQVAVLTNVDFKTNSKAAANIGSGKGKATIARIFGDYNKADPQAVYERALELINDTSGEWVQVGMNPFRHSFFYDKADGMPVTSATEVIQIGPLVLAKNVKKVTRDDPMFSINPKDLNDPKKYYKGGLVSPLGEY
tara:strand:- start:1056 stop:4106 length:3051 start_codon:yes stop_codon:yes gene_type:complete